MRFPPKRLKFKAPDYTERKIRVKLQCDYANLSTEIKDNALDTMLHNARRIAFDALKGGKEIRVTVNIKQL